jgi:hypothetical protein
MKKHKKEMIIVIPGPDFVKAGFGAIQKLIVKAYSLTHVVKPVYTNYANAYTSVFRREGKDSIWLHWNRGLTPISKWLAVKRLRKLIKKYKNTHDVKIVGISLGGEIALEAAKKSLETDIKKIVLISPVIENPEIKFKKIKVFNIYSENDTFAKIAARVLWPIHGNFKLKNILNIRIPKFSHDSFCRNDIIPFGKYKGKRPSHIVDKFLKD